VTSPAAERSAGGAEERSAGGAGERSAGGAERRSPGGAEEPPGPGLHLRRRWQRVALDVLICLVAAAGSGFVLYGSDPWTIALGVLACAGLLVRRRWPWVSLVLALPGFWWGGTFLPVMVALFTLGVQRTRRWETTIGVAAAALVYLVSMDAWDYLTFLTETVVYAALYTAVPALLGAFLRARRLLAAQLVELREAQGLERRQAAQVALARERAVLAREMHDVVSHQVSLIAVQAGALQMASPDEQARDVARTIRGLSVTTLDELRSMVEVLRAAGGHRRELAPQPTLADVDRLVADSGIDVTCRLDLPATLSPSQQRAVYRTVQEGLTNARKHSTGAAVAVTGLVDGGQVVLHVDAGAATLPLLDLPSAHHGLTGLGERAELLGGTVTSETHDDGSHRLTLRFPA
jgi:signal transduction histidine kinase